MRGRTYKDVVLRFYRLMGYDVWAQAGWDEQGLPVEIEVEKKLGITCKKDIEKIGLERFSLECNALVDYYLEKWSDLATWRLGLWLDLENAYETRRARYIEYVWRFIKLMWEKGLLFEDYRVLPFCPRCETALSDAEVDQGYEDRVDPSIYVKFPIEGEEDAYLIIWTTTPWTLIDNEAVAVHPDFEYALVKVERDGRIERYWIAARLVERVMEKIGVKKYEIVKVVRGKNLEGLRYKHVYADKVQIHKEHDDRAHYVVTATFVTLEEGTGLVHVAPAHGPEDFEVAKKYGLPITNSVDSNGRFNELAGGFKGKYWLDVSREVIEDLRRRGLLLHEETIVHRYPHCWRCGTPLIYRADRQWFIRVTAFRDKLLEEVKRVRIVPEHLRDRFENFIANARDWTISRSRVWGTPLPVWRCKDDPNKILVIGSLDELRRLAKYVPEVPDDLLVHRPWIDKVRIETEDCREWVREPFVVDVWLDSGIAWIASIDGLRNEGLFELLYPYDFVTEGIDQTRGWFYSLLTTSVAWMGKAPYKTILMIGHVVDKYGQKMSKSKGNVIWAEDLYAKWGTDATRLYVLYKSAPWDVMSADIEEVSRMRSVLNILWNVVKFADTYMTLDKFDPKRHRLEDLLGDMQIEDKWLLSTFYSRLKRIIEAMYKFEIHEATREWIDLIVEDLSHRYIRIIRRRVWIEEEKADKYAAYAALYHVLKGALIAGSMFVPHIAEYLWQAFIKKYEPDEAESVHLTRMPGINEGLINERLESTFELMFRVFSDIAELRNRIKVKLRWPLPRAYIRVPAEFLKDFENLRHILAHLANVKEIIVTDQPFDCPEGQYVRHVGVNYEVCLSRTIDERLYMEALAREVIRRIQAMRSKARLNVEERVRVYIATKDEELLRAIREFERYISEEVRAIELKLEEPPQGAFTMDWDIEDKRVRIGIERLARQ